MNKPENMSAFSHHFFSLLFVLTIVLILAACGGEPQTLEVTRVVTQEVQVTVEVVQLATVEVEVEVEVTRLVEVPATPTTIPTSTPLPEPTATTPAEPTATNTNTPEPVTNNVYTVVSGDTLSLISSRTGVSVANITAANNLTTQSLLSVGQELIIPNWDGSLAPIPTAPPITPVPTNPATPVDPSSLTNLFPNPSFEADWYYFNGVSEWQIPVGWLMSADEGPNPFTDDPNDTFFRPEIRVVPSYDLAAGEQSSFIFDGNKTIKAFKGYAPTSFAIFTDIDLQPGTYQFTARYFPDIVAGYENNRKIWAAVPFAAEVRVIQNNGGTDWFQPAIGQQNSYVYEFTLTQPGTVRLGMAFRNRFPMNNNGWFIDHWSLVKRQ
ncbi:MAG TPA: LysM peptidoglycan-binding domain-containing protein [Anaerolineae bacterium]|nr:LysM peptidoglycan-binding domain-containing protein [Anaerolineae bacterium]